MNSDQCCLNGEHTRVTPGQHVAVTHVCVVSPGEPVSGWCSMVQTGAIHLSTWSMAAPSSASVQCSSGHKHLVAVILIKDSLLS